MKKRLLAQWAAAGAAAGVVAAAAPPLANAGHPLGSPGYPGDCIYSHGYINCFDWYRFYAGSRFPLYLRSMRQTNYPNYFNPLIQQAELNWNAANGPQNFSPADWGSPQTYVYYNSVPAYGDPNHDLDVSGLGITYLCSNARAPGEPQCRDTNWPSSDQWAVIYLAEHQAFGSGAPPGQTTSVIAHEIGHVLHLWHHVTSIPNDPLMSTPFYSDQPFYEGPTALDTGNPAMNCRDRPVSTYADWGVVCIFQYYVTTPTPSPTAVPTATNTPVPPPPPPPGGK